MANSFLIIYRSAHLMVTCVTRAVTTEKRKMFRKPIKLLEKNKIQKKRKKFSAKDDNNAFRYLRQKRIFSSTRRSTCASRSRTSVRRATRPSPTAPTCRSTRGSTLGSSRTVARSASASSPNSPTFNSTSGRTQGTSLTSAGYQVSPWENFTFRFSDHWPIWIFRVKQMFFKIGNIEKNFD